MELINTSKSFGNICVFRGLNLKVQKGDRKILTGHNGIGKTTLFEILSDQLLIDAGTFNQADDFVVGYAPCRSEGYFPNLTGAENLKYFSNILGNEKQDYIKMLLAKFRNNNTFNASLEIKFNKMSSGMRKINLLLVSLLHKPSLILWDEPFQNLDTENREFLKEIIGEMDVDTAIYIIEHSPELFIKGFEVVAFESLINA